MAGLIPKEKVKATAINPRTMIIIAYPKVGKTEALTELPNNLILDFDIIADDDEIRGGTDFYDALAVKVESFDKLKEVYAELVEEAAKGNKHDYITFDTFTSMYEMAVNEYAVILYNQEKNEARPLDWNIDTLDYGLGQKFKRDATKRIIEMFMPLAKKCLILVGHIADKSSNKNDKTINVSDMDIEGKLKNIVALKVDAIAVMRRKSKNQNILSFVTSDEIMGGGRAQHLRGKEIVISEKQEDGSLKTYWDDIFLPEK